MPRPQHLELDDLVEQEFPIPGAPNNLPRVRRGRVAKVEKATALVKFEGSRNAKRVMLSRLRVVEAAQPDAPAVVAASPAVVAAPFERAQIVAAPQAVAPSDDVTPDDIADDVRTLRELARSIKARAREAVVTVDAEIEALELELELARARLTRAKNDLALVQRMNREGT